MNSNELSLIKNIKHTTTSTSISTVQILASKVQVLIPVTSVYDTSHCKFNASVYNDSVIIVTGVVDMLLFLKL